MQACQPADLTLAAPTSSHPAFPLDRTLTPHDGHPVFAVSWSPSGDAFLSVDGSSQAKVYDRDGKERGETVRGDMYIRDMRNTKGHISGLTGGCWHPTDKFTAMTCSEDGTIRWDKRLVQSV